MCSKNFREYRQENMHVAISTYRVKIVFRRLHMANSCWQTIDFTEQTARDIQFLAWVTSSLTTIRCVRLSLSSVWKKRLHARWGQLTFWLPNPIRARKCWLLVLFNGDASSLCQLLASLRQLLSSYTLTSVYPYVTEHLESFTVQIFVFNSLLSQSISNLLFQACLGKTACNGRAVLHCAVLISRHSSPAPFKSSTFTGPR